MSEPSPLTPWSPELSSGADGWSGPGDTRPHSHPCPATALPAQRRNRCSCPHPGTAPVFSIRFAFDDFDLKRNYHPKNFRLEDRLFGTRFYKTNTASHTPSPATRGLGMGSPAHPFERLFFFPGGFFCPTEALKQKKNFWSEAWLPPSLTLISRPPSRGRCGLLHLGIPDL